MMQLGIMSGRLTKNKEDKAHCFPVDTWKKEFKISSKLGINAIEWVVDSNSLDINPIINNKISEVKRISSSTSINIPVLNAYIFFEKRLYGKKDNKFYENKYFLHDLITKCAKIKIPIIEIPLLGKNSLKDNDITLDTILSNINEEIKLASKLKVKLAFEIDVKHDLVIPYLSDNLPIGITIDTGNYYSFGYNLFDEIHQLNKYIINVHIKDHKDGFGNVKLGTGTVDFSRVFKSLKLINYDSNVILEIPNLAKIFNLDSKIGLSNCREHLRFIKDQLL